jgi:hypothetical protein
VKATLREGQTTEQLNAALKEFGITDSFKKERPRIEMDHEAVSVIIKRAQK